METGEGKADFLGCGWKFPPQVDRITGRVRTSLEEEDIREAIKVILFTRKGERVMRPDFGCGIQNYAFSDMNMNDLKSMEQDILDAVIRWEPRVMRPEVFIDKSKMGQGILEINIAYITRSTNNSYNLVFPYYLNEGS